MGVEVGGVLLVGVHDVIDQPVVEERQHVDRLTRDPIFAKLRDRVNELLMLYMVSGERRIFRPRHERFFRREVGLRVAFQLLDDSLNDLGAFAGLHCFVQFVDQGKEFYVFRIATSHLHAVAGFPIVECHNQFIGSGRTTNRWTDGNRNRIAPDADTALVPYPTTFLQIDQAAPAHQALPRNQPKRREEPDLVRRRHLYPDRRLEHRQSGTVLSG